MDEDRLMAAKREPMICLECGGSKRPGAIWCDKCHHGVMKPDEELLEGVAEPVEEEDLKRWRPRYDEDCEGCGACCSPGVSAPKDEGFVELTHGDIVGLGLLPLGRDQDLVVKKKITGSAMGGGPSPNSSGFYLRVIPQRVNGREERRCGLLQGYVGDNAHCGVYARRPHGCRDFKRSSLGCCQVRKNFHEAGAEGFKPRMKVRKRFKP